MFDYRRFLLEQEIKEIDDMKARGEDLSEREFYKRDLLTGLYGAVSHRHRRNVLTKKLNDYLREQEKSSDRDF